MSMEKMMSTLSNRRYRCYAVIVCAFLNSVTGITLSPCGTDNTVELLETRVDNAVTCSGIPDINYNVNWEVKLPGRWGQDIVGTCTAGSTQCTYASTVGYQATRPSADTSVLSINPRLRVEFVRNGTLECKATRVTKHPQSASCRLDITAPPSSVNCTVHPVPSASLWTVAGRCDVTKIYSSLGRYSCHWESAGTAVNKSVSMQTTPTTDVTPTNGTYVNGFCDVTMPWPSADASYRVVVSPGGGSHDAGKIDNPCVPNPCQNNGSCGLHAVDAARFTCNCTAGFVNTTCNVLASTPANTGLIVGGVVGGVALLTMGAIVVVVLKRNKPMQTNAASTLQATHHTAGQPSSAVQRPSHTMTASADSRGKTTLSEKDEGTSGDSSRPTEDTE